MLEASHLSYIWLQNISSQILGCLFIMLQSFKFYKDQFISFLSLLLLVIHGFIYWKPLPNPKLLRFTHFLPKSIIVLVLRFRCMIHIKLILYMMWGVRYGDFACNYYIVWAPFVEEIIFPHWIFGHLCQALINHEYKGFLQTFKWFSLIYLSILEPATILS